MSYLQLYLVLLLLLVYVADFFSLAELNILNNVSGTFVKKERFRRFLQNLCEFSRGMLDPFGLTDW